MKRHIIALMIFFLTTLPGITQDKKPTQIKAVVSGSVIASLAGNAVYSSFGGPGVKITNGTWSVGLYMLPSLRFQEDKPRPLVTPVLGTGLLIGYKRLIFGLPLYYVAQQLKWKAGVGIGAKIGK
jgi:hypothetical protein